MNNNFNQCVSGDTKVLTVGGPVTFKELADKNEDVLVYCLNENGEIVTSKMFHPRITGYKRHIYKITLENGVVVKATGNHKFLTPVGYKRVDELYEDDAITIFHSNFNLTEMDSNKFKFLTCEGTKKGTIMKKCEFCGNDFEIEWDMREICVCNEHNNFYEYYNTIIDLIEKYTHACKYLRINNMEFISKGIDVYNGTVAVYHNYFTYDDSTKTMINQLNCGEVNI